MKPLLLAVSLVLTGLTIAYSPHPPVEASPRTEIIDPMSRYRAAVKLCAILMAQDTSETKETIRRDLNDCFVAALPRA